MTFARKRKIPADAEAGALMKNLPTSSDDPRLDGWYHTVDLGNGLIPRARFDHRTVVDRYGIPESLEGKTVLDVATGDGFFAFEMERRGAERVVAIDVARLGDCDWVPRMKVQIGAIYDNGSWPARFRLAHAMRKSKVEYRHCSVYDLSPYTIGTFDVVFCGDLLLHLQQPLAALHAIRSVTREMAVIETVLDPELEEAFPGQSVLRFGHPHPEDQVGENNSYWQFTTTALQTMLAYADFPDTEPQGTFLLPPTGPMGTAVVAYTYVRG